MKKHASHIYEKLHVLGRKEFKEKIKGEQEVIVGKKASHKNVVLLFHHKK